MKVPYFERINDNLSCSGQPRAEQFSEIANEGYEIVMNLADELSIGFISDEKTIVEATGMKYIHLPVSLNSPQIYDVLKFFAIMNGSKGKRTLVHCTSNVSSSFFIYLYRKFILQIGEAENLPVLNKYTQIIPEWNDLIEQLSALH